MKTFNHQGKQRDAWDHTCPLHTRIDAIAKPKHFLYPQDFLQNKFLENSLHRTAHTLVSGASPLNKQTQDHQTYPQTIAHPHTFPNLRTYTKWKNELQKKRTRKKNTYKMKKRTRKKRTKTLKKRFGSGNTKNTSGWLMSA